MKTDHTGSGRTLHKMQKLAFERAKGIKLAEDPETYDDDNGDLWVESWVRVRDVVFDHVDPDEIFANTDALLEKYEEFPEDVTIENNSSVPRPQTRSEHNLDLDADGLPRNVNAWCQSCGWESPDKVPPVRCPECNTLHWTTIPKAKANEAL